MVDFLKDPKSYGRLGARMPKGVLLVGPPGTGKTLLARAVAGEAGVPFFSISGSEFVEMFVGVGAARVRDLFEQAREQAPCIVFIDELDALGRARGACAASAGTTRRSRRSTSSWSRWTASIRRTGIVLLAATNRPEILDPALLRAGRFDRQVLVDRPDRPGAAAILAVHAAQGASWRPTSISTRSRHSRRASPAPTWPTWSTRPRCWPPGATATAVSMSDFNEAVERIVAGLEKQSRAAQPARAARWSPITKWATRWWRCRCPAPTRCTRSRSSRAASARSATPSSGRPRTAILIAAHELENRMAVLLGGRAAETLVFDDDLDRRRRRPAKATDIARAMVTRFGMIDSFGPATFEAERQDFLGGPAGSAEPWRRENSEATMQVIDGLVRDLVRHALERAGDLLRERREVLERAAKSLLERETLNADDLTALVGEKPRLTAEPAAAARG